MSGDAGTGVKRNLFRFRKVGAKWVVTTDHGTFAILDD